MIPRFARQLQEAQRERDMQEKIESAQREKILKEKQLEQETRLAKELEKIKLKEQREERLRQHIRENR